MGQIRVFDLWVKNQDFRNNETYQTEFRNQVPLGDVPEMCRLCMWKSGSLKVIRQNFCLQYQCTRVNVKN